MELPSNKKFGYFFSTVFLLVAGYFYYSSSNGFAKLFLILSIAIMITAFIKPEILFPLNRAWMSFGLLLGRIVSPIVLGLIFFAMLTPVALISRMSGRDELKLKRMELRTYWKERDPKGPQPDSFIHQY
ncbi:SxtJ family membrane protein [Gammaproteobacteria bacterium]|nr:SxtJ family membrane protein [Gammaproteobacteria bacterium]